MPDNSRKWAEFSALLQRFARLPNTQFGLSELGRIAKAFREAPDPEALKLTKQIASSVLSPCPTEPALRRVTAIEGRTILDLSAPLAEDGSASGLTLSQDGFDARAGGTGPNAARVLACFGVSAQFVGLCDGIEGEVWRRNLYSDLPFADLSRLRRGSSRSSIFVTVERGSGGCVVPFAFRPPTPPLTASEATRLQNAIADVPDLVGTDQTGSFAILGGQLWPGCDLENYTQTAQLLRTKGYSTVWDAKPYMTTAELHHVLAGQPSIVKANQSEFETCCGRTFGTPRTPEQRLAISREAQIIAARYGVQCFVVTLGEHGLVAAHLTSQRYSRTQRWEYEQLHVPAPSVQARSDFGGGDACIGAMIAHTHPAPPSAPPCVTVTTPPIAFVAGVAAGSGAVALPGTRMPSRALIQELMDGIEVTRFSGWSTPTR